MRPNTKLAMNLGMIVAGMLIVGELMDHYRQREMRVTGHGVRYGLLYELAASS